MVAVFLFVLVWKERIKYGRDYKVELSDWGIRIARGSKQEQYPWSDFSKGMTWGVYMKNTKVPLSDEYYGAATHSYKLTKEAFGEAFMLIWKNQSWFKLSAGLTLLAEPDNDKQVEEFLKNHVKWGS